MAERLESTVENIAAIEREGICAYFPLSEGGQRAGRFGEHDFVYDAAADTFRCPGSQTLRFLSYCQSTQRSIYAAPTAACAACTPRSQCATSHRGRRVGRHFDEAYRERVRAYHATEYSGKAMRKRQVWVEPLFAEAKAWHGLRRFRLRGLEQVSGEALLIAAGGGVPSRAKPLAMYSQHSPAADLSVMTAPRCSLRLGRSSARRAFSLFTGLGRF